MKKILILVVIFLGIFCLTFHTGATKALAASDYANTLIAYMNITKNGSSQLKVMTGEGDNKRVLDSTSNDGSVISDFAWSPDGKKILYHILIYEYLFEESWLVDLNSGQKIKLSTSDQDGETCHLFSLQSDYLLCSSYHSLFILDLQGKNKKILFEESKIDIANILGWTNNGERIYFRALGTYQQPDIFWRVNKDGSDPRQVTYTYLPAASTKIDLGQKLRGKELCSYEYGVPQGAPEPTPPAAYFTDAQGNLQALGIDEEKEVEGFSYSRLRLSPDGKKIVYKRMQEDELWLYELGTGKDENFSSPFSTKPFYPSWSPDGQYITYASGDGYIELLASDINERRGEIKNFGTATIILAWPSEGQPVIPVWQPMASSQPVVVGPNPDEELQFNFEEDFLKMLDLPLAVGDLQNNWQVNDVLWHDVIYEGEAATMDVLLQSKNVNWRLKPGTKVYVSFQLYDKKAPFSLNQVWTNLTGEEALLYFKPYISEVVVGTGPNEAYDIVRVKDVVFSPATFPDMLKVGVAVNIKDYGMAYAFGEREVYVEFSKNAILNCTYGVVDGTLAYLSAGAVPALTKAASFLEVFKDAFNLTRTAEDRTTAISQFFNNQQYIEAGRELAYLVMDIKVALAADTDPTKIVLTILEYLIKGADCVKAALNLPFMIERFVQGLIEVFIDKGIEPPNVVFLESPAMVLVTTAAGQKIGFDESGNVVNELGDKAGVIAEHPNTIVFPGIRPFEVAVSGKESGTYNLTIFQTKSANESGLISYTNVVSAPQSKASVKIDPASQEYLLNIDENNDGIIDSTKKPDKFELIKGVPKQASETQPSSQKKSHWLWYLILGVVLAAILTVVVIILYKKGMLQKILKRG